MHNAYPYSPGCGQKVQQAIGRHDEIGLQHLDIEAETGKDGAEQQPAQLARLRRPQHSPCPQQHDQHQRAINGVVAVGYHANRADRQGQCC